jgi:hypothetical protein
MKNRIHKKGMIIAAMAFILCIIIGLSAVISLFWSKVPMSVSRIKRFQAINHAEAGLYESFNRFRRFKAGEATGVNVWNPDIDATYNISIDGVPVVITVGQLHGRRHVSATVNESDINL